MILDEEKVVSKLMKPATVADKLGLKYSNTVDDDHKKNNGQFFTPKEIAYFMSDMFTTRNKESIRILDPGAGVGILSCALVEKIINDVNSKVSSIYLELYETDEKLLPDTEYCLNHLSNYCRESKIAFIYRIKNEDFVLDSINVIENEQFDGFDYIISNPPFFKLLKEDTKVLASKNHFKGVINIYSLFMEISSKLLNQFGEMVFITPRSFASGRYFQEFRNVIFSSLFLEKVHVFSSRSQTFKRDKVLQETIITKYSKNEFDVDDTVVISTSNALEDLAQSHITKYCLRDIVDLQSSDLTLHLPTTDFEDKVLKTVNAWSNNLRSLGIQISTGPIVSFRCREALNNFQDSDIKVPLIWLHNVNKMHLEWPKEFKDRSHYVKNNGLTFKTLVPNRNYILLRRFSTKDDKSRLIASPFYSRRFAEFNAIGIENKVNYLYKIDSELEEVELLGLTALLNSTLFDTYFRMINGSVNVSASELRIMKFPSSEEINIIGSKLINEKEFTTKIVDDIVNQLFHISYGEKEAT